MDWSWVNLLETLKYYPPKPAHKFNAANVSKLSLDDRLARKIDKVQWLLKYTVR